MAAARVGLGALRERETECARVAGVSTVQYAAAACSCAHSPACAQLVSAPPHTMHTSSRAQWLGAPVGTPVG